VKCCRQRKNIQLRLKQSRAGAASEYLSSRRDSKEGLTLRTESLVVSSFLQTRRTHKRARLVAAVDALALGRVVCEDHCEEKRKEVAARRKAIFARRRRRQGRRCSFSVSLFSDSCPCCCTPPVARSFLGPEPSMCISFLSLASQSESILTLFCFSPPGRLQKPIPR
jgi:hypothetical protein